MGVVLAAEFEQITGTRPTQSLRVHRADDVRVINGANLGDPITEGTDLSLSDIYVLRDDAASDRLSLCLADGGYCVADGSDLGRPGAAVHLDCTVTFMAPDGETVDALVMVELDAESHLAATYVMPFAPLHPRRDYALVKIDQSNLDSRLAGVACVSFTRGTRITTANGLQVPIETLRPGDRILTRDNGAQAIRWIGQQTVRATGAFAPILIKAGALHNERDLTVSANHRLFIYQRRDRISAGAQEILVRAELLANGVTVQRTNGGYVDYFQILFDNHEIIYAEGIAAESLFVDHHVRPYLPLDVRLTAHQSDIPNASHRHVLDLQDALVDTRRAADLLRAASHG